MGQCADVRMMPEALVAKNRSGAAATSTSQGVEKWNDCDFGPSPQITELAMLLREGENTYHKSESVGRKTLWHRDSPSFSQMGMCLEKELRGEETLLESMPKLSSSLWMWKRN